MGYPDKLYKKTPDGEYEVVPGLLYDAEAEEGIWYIRKIKDGMQRTWLCKKLFDKVELFSCVNISDMKPALAASIYAYLNKISEKGLLQVSSIKVSELVNMIKGHLTDTLKIRGCNVVDIK